MANFLDQLTTGDVCGISEYSRHYRNRVYRRVCRAVVIKTTKTTITVERKWGNTTKQFTFNRSNGKERGSKAGGYWYADSLISFQDYSVAVQQHHIERAKQDRIIKRDALIKVLSDSVKNDEAFRVALEALNQQEYV